MVPINYLAVVVAGLSQMVLGSVWYGPLFGKQWIAMAGFTPADIEAGKKQGMGKSYALAALGSLATAFVLAHALEFAMAYLGTEGVSAGLQTGFWNWLGFVAPITMGDVIWGKKTWKLWTLNNGYNLLSLLVMGVILALWQ